MMIFSACLKHSLVNSSEEPTGVLKRHMNILWSCVGTNSFRSGWNNASDPMNSANDNPKTHQRRSIIFGRILRYNDAKPLKLDSTARPNFVVRAPTARNCEARIGVSVRD